MSEKQEFISTRKGVTYLDLFAGAGGFSEGFMQAYTDDKYYDFYLASDINENCELTHRVRYNKMLGLDTKFICQDIMEDSFLPNLLKEIGNKEIEVVTGGPSCQSFSLAGRRKKLDKRDDLFYHYLKVIKALRPKYFVMENVKGILTKDEGRIKERILREIRSIVDDAKMNQLFAFLDDVLKPQMSTSLYNALYERLCMVTCADNLEKLNEFFFNNLDLQLKEVTRHLPYSVSKSNESVNTIRHGLLLLGMKQQRDAIRKQIIQLKTSAHIDNDTFVDGYNAIIETISDEQILEQTLDAIDKVTQMGGCEEEAKILKKSLELLTSTFDECIEYIQEQFKDKAELLNHLNRLIKEVRLYNIEDIAVWRLVKLHQRLQTKHRETFWIEVENELSDGKEYFRYKQIEHTKNPNVGQFDILLEQNIITVDLLLCRPSGHGDTYSFKIKKKGMPLLFPESKLYLI